MVLPASGSGALAVARLSEVFRQAASSRIITSAHAINTGQLPDLRPPAEGGASDFYFAQADTPEQAVALQGPPPAPASIEVPPPSLDRLRVLRSVELDEAVLLVRMGLSNLAQDLLKEQAGRTNGKITVRP